MKIQEIRNSRRVSSMRRGFSLFEMVVVMGIIGMLITAVVMLTAGFRGSANIQNTKIALNAFDAKLDTYKDIGGTYPSTEQGLKALMKRPTTSPRPSHWTPSITKERDLIDAWGLEYRYQFPGSKDKRRPEVISAGEDGQFGTIDDLSSQAD